MPQAEETLDWIEGTREQFGHMTEGTHHSQEEQVFAPSQVTLVVSDLHLSSEEALDDFYADHEFAEFLEYHAKTYERVHLIIAGDFIDFLQSDPRPARWTKEGSRQTELEEIWPINLSEDESVTILEKVVARHSEFFEALKRFVEPGAPTRRITVLKGNHDVEFAFPKVQARFRQILGSPDAEALSFPPVGWYDPDNGVYVEHGSQYDAWNALIRFDDPFLDEARTQIETPWGAVQVKTLWNRVEPEFPHIDKMRPMLDGVLAMVLQRPTFLVLKFDYFVDLFVHAWRQNLKKLFARRPKRRERPSKTPTPEEIGRKHWRRDNMGRVSLGVFGVLAAYFVVRYMVLWDTGLRGVAIRSAARPLGEFFLLVVGSVSLIAIARGIRFLMWRKDMPHLLRNVVYRLLVMVSAVAFCVAMVRLFLLPILFAIAIFIVWDAVHTIIGQPSAEKDPLLRRPLPSDLAVAIRMLHLTNMHAVVLGHTHIPMSVEVGEGKRYVNSGTWMKVVDIRNVRSEPNELNTYVRIVGSRADLMSWRGTTPARPYQR